MKIPPDALIPRAKLTKYLLVWQEESDKSKFLAQAGFTQENPDELESAIRQIIANNNTVFDHKNRFGVYYRVTGTLVGPLRHSFIATIWIVRHGEDQYRFVTLVPEN